MKRLYKPTYGELATGKHDCDPKYWSLWDRCLLHAFGNEGGGRVVHLQTRSGLHWAVPWNTTAPSGRATSWDQEIGPSFGKPRYGAYWSPAEAVPTMRNFTALMVVKVTSGDRARLLSHNSGGANNGWNFWVETTGDLRFTLGGVQDHLLTSHVLATDTWYVIAGAYSEENNQCYVASRPIFGAAITTQRISTNSAGISGTPVDLGLLGIKGLTTDFTPSASWMNLATVFQHYDEGLCVELAGDTFSWAYKAPTIVVKTAPAGVDLQGVSAETQAAAPLGTIVVSPQLAGQSAETQAQAGTGTGPDVVQLVGAGAGAAAFAPQGTTTINVELAGQAASANAQAPLGDLTVDVDLDGVSSEAQASAGLGEASAAVVLQGSSAQTQASAATGTFEAVQQLVGIGAATQASAGTGNSTISPNLQGQSAETQAQAGTGVGGVTVPLDGAGARTFARSELGQTTINVELVAAPTQTSAEAGIGTTTVTTTIDGATAIAQTVAGIGIFPIPGEPQPFRVRAPGTVWRPRALRSIYRPNAPDSKINTEMPEKQA